VPQRESEIPFSFVIADVLEKHGAFDFILSEPGRRTVQKLERVEYAERENETRAGLMYRIGGCLRS
jgi:hypothetical protein